VGPVALVVAGVLGAAGGQLSGRLADAVAAPRYGPGTDGFDPEDAELAPLHPPTTARQRAWLSALGAAGLVAIAASLDDGWTVAYFGALLLGYLSAMTVDLQYLRLPNVFTYPAALFAVAGAWGLSQHLDQPVAGAVAGLVTYAGFLWLTRIAYQLVRGREGMGLGDVKLALSLGASAGWLGGLLVDPAAIGAVQLVIYAVLLGNLLGAFGGLLLVRQFDREFPFGPALVAGWLIVVVAADTLVG
jgi:leader peptidase (prepilin peptidase) / N-methyltransferase